MNFLKNIFFPNKLCLVEVQLAKYYYEIPQHQKFNPPLVKGLDI